MKSEGLPPNELAVQQAKALRDRLLPEKGAEFEIQYYAGEVPVKYGEEPHTWANAISDGLRVIVWGDDAYVAHRRQRKPMIPELFFGEDGAYRRMLIINLGDVWIHILGDLIIIDKKRLNVAQLVNDQSLTDSDRQIMDLLRERMKDGN